MTQEPIVEKALPPPLTSGAWAAEIVSQSLEIFPVFRDEDGLAWLKPMHADSLRIGTSPARTPADTVLRALERYGVTPIVVHSTSWRTQADRMILTYAAIVRPFAPKPEGPLRMLRIGRADLARGEATAAPKVIDVEQVIEHALRHLSWLVKDDPVIAEALSDWRPTLESYTPEPFRAFQS
ncbi:MAG: hypothetical protein ACYDCC_08070 [Actinomycetota bacterium]